MKCCYSQQIIVTVNLNYFKDPTMKYSPIVLKGLIEF